MRPVLYHGGDRSSDRQSATRSGGLSSAAGEMILQSDALSCEHKNLLEIVFWVGLVNRCG